MKELPTGVAGFLESSIKNYSAGGWAVELAGQAASTRKFFRVSRKNESYILIIWDSKDEDWPRFLEIEAFISQKSRLLPKIHAADPVNGFILEEDLGALTLKKFCEDSMGEIGVIEKMYRRVIDVMRGWHELDIADCRHISSRSMDVDMFLWETDYFARYCVCEYLGMGGLLSADWEKERRLMAEHAASLPKVCMHRDFQSENVLIHDDRIRFVDFQGARMGPAHYDAASLLFDPYVNQLEVDSVLVSGLIDYYFSGQEAGGRGRSFLQKDFYICAAHRLMQALGAYANLTVNRGKPHYSQFINPALKRLSHIFSAYLPDYPAMGSLGINSSHL
jgi:aminoglycoside/choline kinase family phosphotransferase